MVLTICFGFHQVVTAATFEEQRKVAAQGVELQSEQAMIKLLKAGIDANHPAQASALASDWLRQNIPKSPELLYFAGRAAELAAEWKTSTALYQQFLQKADPESVLASDAIVAVHSLLIDELKDAEAAYVFARDEASRLAVNPNFRQYDRWFLNAAKSRKDAPAVAIRLRAMVESGTSNDVLAAFYEDDLHWLHNWIRNLHYNSEGMRFSEGFVKAVHAVAAGITFDRTLGLMLDWAVAVKAYNMTLIGGGEAEPPLAEAKALIEHDARYALMVQTDWAGGRRGRHYRDDPKKYWPDQVEKKMAPIRAALPKLSPLDQAKLIASWSSGYYHGGPNVLSTEEVRGLVMGYSEVIDQKFGPALVYDWSKLDAQRAQELIGLLSKNPDSEVSLVAAVAAGGEEKDFDRAVEVLLGREAWRLNKGELEGKFVDALWHWAGKPGGNEKRDQAIARSKKIAQKIPEKEIEAKAPVAKRQAEFKKFWSDFRSDQPKIPAVRERMMRVLQVTPEAVDDLLRDPSPVAQWVLKQALHRGFNGPTGPISGDKNAVGVSTSNYNPLILRLADRRGGLARFKGDKNLYQPYPLESLFRQMIARRLELDATEEWMVMAWINMQFPEDKAEPEKLIQAIRKSSNWKAFSPQLRYGARAWFREAAMTNGQVAALNSADANEVFKSLRALGEESDVATVTAALKSAKAGMEGSPVRLSVQGLEKLGQVKEEVFANSEVMEMLIDLEDTMRLTEIDHGLGNRLISILSKQRDPADLLKMADYLWQHVERYHRPLNPVMGLTESLLTEQPEAARALALCGLASIERREGGHTWYTPKTITDLKSVRGRASMELGLIEIPVAKNDPTYPIYQSQAEWITGNDESAWELVEKNWEPFMEVHRKLTVPYLFWALERVAYGRDEARQEAFMKSLLSWVSEQDSSLSPAEKIQIELAYGDMAMQRGQLRQAREIFLRVENNKAYQSSSARFEATLRRAQVERGAKDYNAALETISELEAERVPGIWVEVRFARAQTHFAMESFDDAKDDIDSILMRDPDHADAKILLGKVQLERQQLMEATEVELGSTMSQDQLVPGEKLKVTLTDPTLAVSGVATEIEVVVWTTTGDREHFFLRQFGDQKTKFRGQVMTALGAPETDDGVLQVIGDDEVYYSYSERFLQKMTGLEEKRGGPITIASDALLMASARKLLSAAEQRTADMEAMMESLGSEAAAKAELATRAIDSSRQNGSFGNKISQVVKPGNPIYVRVVDPDRSRTELKDSLLVSAVSSSGDSVSRIELTETETHSGWFEGVIPTAGAQPMAMAENSEPGRNPNMVISPNESYPAWRPVPSSGNSPLFTVDMNDNIELGEMMITAREPNAKLKKFIVETAMNPSSWQAVATLPESKMMVMKPWEPSITVVNEAGRKAHYGARSVSKFNELKQHLEWGWLKDDPKMAYASNVVGPSEALPDSIPKAIEWRRSGRWENPAVAVRFQAYFYEDAAVTRRFALKLGKHDPAKSGIKGNKKSYQQPAEFLIAINGRAITDPSDSRLTGEINLGPGVHRFEIWATGWLSNIGFGRKIDLQANLDDPNKLVACPDTFFDPKTFPSGVLDHRNAPARIEVAENGTEFRVRFPSNAKARMLRLRFVDQEGPVPTLNKISLKNAKGKAVLPVEDDFAELQKNDMLEILPNDRVTVRYVDDRFVTKNNIRHERSIEVAFTDARVEFADIEPRFNEGKNRYDSYYEKLLRFKHDEPLSLVVRDADMDATVEPDKVRVKLSSQSGGEREFEAIETGDSTGIFRLFVNPVNRKAKSDKEFQVAKGEVIHATYFDKENNRPAVPVERTTSITHALFATPVLRVSHAQAEPINLEKSNPSWRPMMGLPLDYFVNHDERSRTARGLIERIQPRWNLNHQMMDADEAPEEGAHAVLGQRMYLELVAPHMIMGQREQVSVYAQTESGRRASGSGGGSVFDVDIPGTIEVAARLPNSSKQHVGHWLAGGVGAYIGGAPTTSDQGELFDRLRVTIPLVMGVLPQYGVLSYDERKELQKGATDLRDQDLRLGPDNALVVNPGERVHIGVRYVDEQGKARWTTAEVRAVAHPVFDLMNEDYRERMQAAFVGENLNMRVVDFGADLSDAVDTVSVLAQAKSGEKRTVTLRETGPHTGVFKAAYPLTYIEVAANAENEEAAEAEDDADANQSVVEEEIGLPVIYGDTVAARYTDRHGVKTETQFVTVSKGADGMIQPFSKVYGDEEIAMRTQFSLAEAYLEMAKRHRKLGQQKLADQEYASAKLLLSKAMDEFGDPETRAHAEYLLGTLTMEEAAVAEDEETKEIRYRAALSRFFTVTGNYPQTIHASKAQYRIATIYESLNEPEVAAQEYVKLAYKYPESEYLATSMARLGSHFLKKAAAYEKQSRPLLAKAEEDKDAAFEGEALRRMATREYLKTAKIFGRLQERFPSNRLAGKAGLRAGQAYMRAGKHRDAVNAFKSVMHEQSYDGPEIRSQAMYWTGMSFQELREPMAAYSIFKRLTYDFPESKWASYARAQLSQENMLRLDKKLELERLEAGLNQ